MSESLREPQLTPSDHCYTILQDHGPFDGGWGPTAVALIPGMDPRPVVYTGSQESAIERFKEFARQLAQTTGKPTRVVRYSKREDIFVVGGSS